MGQWDKICSIISRVCGAKANLFSITQLFVRLFVRDNVCSHAEAQSSHRELCFPQNCIRPADNDFLSRRNGGNGRNFNYYLILMSIDNHAAWRA